VPLAGTGTSIRGVSKGDANMVRRWMGVALMAAGLAVAAPARAQYMPVPVGAARMPEPQPSGPSCEPPPNLVPGPLNPTAAPMGPPNDLSLPCNHSSAFQCEEFAGDCHWYFAAGAQWLQRQKLGGGVVAVNDPDRSIALEFNNLTQTMNGGVRGTVGYMSGDCALEYTGFYIPTENKTVGTVRTGLLDALFMNPPPQLQDSNGSMFFQGQRVSETFGSSFWNNEANVRRWNCGLQGADLIAGVRYVQEDETLSIDTEPNRDRFLAIRSITSKVDTRNRLLTLQLGCEYECTIPCTPVSLGFSCKGAWGANFLETTNSLLRGDGLQVFNVNHADTVFTQIYDLGVFVDVQLLERLRLRGGYNTLWLLGVATAVDQLDFNLRGVSRAPQLFNTNGSIFWHGPMVELEFLF
jgi:hypothetical protein